MNDEQMFESGANQYEERTKTWLSGIVMAVKYRQQLRINAHYICIVSGVVGTTTAIDAWSLQSPWIMGSLAAILFSQCVVFGLRARNINKTLKPMIAYMDLAFKGASLMASEQLTPEALAHLEDQAAAARAQVLKGLRINENKNKTE